jgi:hypothetical protein
LEILLIFLAIQSLFKATELSKKEKEANITKLEGSNVDDAIASSELLINENINISS